MDWENYKSPNNSDININELTLTPEKKKKTWLWVLIAVLALIAAAVILYFFCPPVHQWADAKIFKREKAEKIAEEPAEEIVETDPFDEAFTSRCAGQKFITTETIRYGGRLARLADKYYGSPDFWVYIYEANTDKLKNPNYVFAGTTVRIPELDPVLIDLRNPKSLEKAQELARQYAK